MLERTERISFRIYFVLSKVEPGAGPSHRLRLRPKSTGTGSDRFRLRNTDLSEAPPLVAVSTHCYRKIMDSPSWCGPTPRKSKPRMLRGPPRKKWSLKYGQSSGLQGFCFRYPVPCSFIFGLVIKIFR